MRRSILRDPTTWLTDGRDPDAVRRGLGTCATFLSALFVLVGDGASARRTARSLLHLRGLGAASLKRVLVLLLPTSASRRLLWGPAEGGLDSGQRERARARIRESGPVDL